MEVELTEADRNWLQERARAEHAGEDLKTVWGLLYDVRY